MFLTLDIYKNVFQRKNSEKFMSYILQIKSFTVNGSRQDWHTGWLSLDNKVILWWPFHGRK